MRFSQRDIAHGWQKVKSHVGRAWLSGKQALHTADHYANLAGRVLNIASPMLSKEIQDSGRAALQMYGRGRGQIQNAVNKYEMGYSAIQKAAPDIF